MQQKQNPLTNDWLCWIPNTSVAYYVSSKKEATKFCDKVNIALDSGKLVFDENGILKQTTARV